MDVTKKRTIALVGHAQAGKTTLAESFLFNSKAINRKGDVMQGTTVSDFADDEQDRKSSINSSYMRFKHKDHQIQMIDTPGYADFVGETISALRAVDAGIVVIDATQGVEVGTDDVWQRMNTLKMPRLIFINKVEKEGVNLDEVMADIKEQLSPKAAILDLESSDLVEAVAETNDALLEKYLEEGSLSADEVKGALHKAVVSGSFFPVFTGTALSDQGVKEVMDAVVNYFPSPVERAPIMIKNPDGEDNTEMTCTADGTFVGFVFKQAYDAHLGSIAIARVFQGSAAGNSNVFNSTQKAKEHIGTISFLQGKEQVPTPQMECGDIVALTKLKNTSMGDTFCDEKNRVTITPIIFPEPSISASIRPKTRSDEDKIAASLARLCEEDHTFRTSLNKETKEMLVSGVGDLHLKIMMDRMRDRFHVDAELGRPKVTYRETITKSGKFRYKYKKQSGGRGQYGDVDLEVRPLNGDADTQYEFESKIFGGAIPRNYIPSVEKGVKKTVSQGVLAGYPVYGIHVSCVDGSYHDVDSSDMAFQIAGAMALKEALKQAGLVLLEPIMEVTITIQGDFMGQISGDLSSRRGRILGTEAKGKKDVIKANIPLSEMFTYSSDLRSLTGGRGSYAMKFSHYDQAPMKVSEKVVAEAAAAAEAAKA